ncbi:MAG: hypothetical protein VYD19_10925 [Myxococcota bacterium]|nr:hypothetical protein [Myxococcota bacterium]
MKSCRAALIIGVVFGLVLPLLTAGGGTLPLRGEAKFEARAALEAKLLQLEGTAAPENDLALLHQVYAVVPALLAQLPERDHAWAPETLGLSRWSQPEPGDLLIFQSRPDSPRVGLFLAAESDRWIFLARSRGQIRRLYLSRIEPSRRRIGARIVNSWLRAYSDEGPAGFYAGELFTLVRAFL